MDGSTDDESHAAIHAEIAALATSRRVLAVAARSDGQPSVHNPTALGAIAHERISSPMVQVRARRGCRRYHRYSPRISAASMPRRREVASMPTASQTFSKLYGQVRSRLAT